MSKAVFPEKPIVRPLAGTDYVLAEDYYFPATVGGWDVTVHVMPGFRTDGASIPRLLWPLFGSPYDPDIIADAIGHDALYRGRIVPRRDADDAFRDMMKRRGRIRAWKRRRIWIGVRLFGWIAWLRHTPEGVAEARRHISLAFAGGGKNNETGLRPEPQKRKTMKKLMMTALAAIAAAMTGCTSTSAEWGGERVITGADGLPLVANDGTVQKAKEPVRLSSWRHWIDTHVDTAKLDVEKDRIEFTMNGYKAEPSEELNKLVETSLKGAAELAAKVGAAIATSGGSVAGDAAYTALRNAISKYISKGGDASKAKITCENGNCTISDGTVTETCTDCFAK